MLEQQMKIAIQTLTDDIVANTVDALVLNALLPPDVREHAVRVANYFVKNNVLRTFDCLEQESDARPSLQSVTIKR